MTRLTWKKMDGDCKVREECLRVVAHPAGVVGLVIRTNAARATYFSLPLPSFPSRLPFSPLRP